MKHEPRNNTCPRCGSCNIATGVSGGYASISKSEFSFSSSYVIHDICTDCGHIIESYVKRPYIFKK